jgi:hypothetical protein
MKGLKTGQRKEDTRPGSGKDQKHCRKVMKQQGDAPRILLAYGISVL